MDIQLLLQRLEDVIEAGRHMPFSATRSLMKCARWS